MTKPHLSSISAEDWQSLSQACRRLEHPSLAARLTSVIGTPIEEGLELLPATWYDRLNAAAEATIHKTLESAISSLPEGTRDANDDVHKILGMTTGAIGGLFGLPALLIELPISTAIMLRSIADIARSQGEDLRSPDTRLACVEVFALGGHADNDNAAETGYYGLRIALALHFSAVQQHLVEHGVARQTAPAVVNLVRAVAARFGVVVSDKAALQMVPVLGALGGALLNAIFIQHFQDMARGHFTVRRLERQYGTDVVKAAYEHIAAGTRAEIPPGPRPVNIITGLSPAAS